MEIKEIQKQLQSYISEINQKTAVEKQWHDKMYNDDTPQSIIQYRRFKLTDDETKFAEIDDICLQLFNAFTDYREILLDNANVQLRLTGDKVCVDALQSENKQPSDVLDEELAFQQEETLLSDEEIIATAETSENA